jgi:hypothetical protein
MCDCEMTRGDYINRRASTGAQIVTLRARIPELEKLARKTPPKTLLTEWVKVRVAKVQLAKAQADLALLELDHAGWRRLEALLSVPNESEE